MCVYCLMSQYLELRDAKIGGERGFLFCSESGGALTKAAFNKSLLLAGISMNKKYKLTGHSARVTGARAWAR